MYYILLFLSLNSYLWAQSHFNDYIHFYYIPSTGSDAVVCRDANKKILSSELLDYFEGREIRNLPSYFEDDLSHEDFFTELKVKLSPISERGLNTEFTNKLLRAIYEFRSTGKVSDPDVSILSVKLIEENPDYGNLPLPPHCKIEQVMITRRPETQSEPTFIINADIIKSFSDKDIRGLIFQSALAWVLAIPSYSEAGKDSVPVRKIHQKLVSVPLSELNFRFLKENLLEDVGGKLYLEDRVCYPKLCSVAEDGTIGVFNGEKGYKYFDQDGKFLRQKTLEKGYAIYEGTLTLRNLLTIRANNGLGKWSIIITPEKGKPQTYESWLAVLATDSPYVSQAEEDLNVSLPYGRFKIQMSFIPHFGAPGFFEFHLGDNVLFKRTHVPPTGVVVKKTFENYINEKNQSAIREVRP